MTQRIFDIDNEKDMALLWSILPDEVVLIKQRFADGSGLVLFKEQGGALFDEMKIITINWHDKTEITRPIQEATEADVGKLCRFWRGNETCCHYGILFGIDKDCSKGKYMMSYSDKYSHCRRLKKQEIEEIC